MSQSAHDWDARYVGSPSLFGEEPNAFLVRRRDRFHPGQRALVVADGSGRHGAWLANLGLVVDAFDVSPEAHRQAQALDARLGVSVRREVCGWEDWRQWQDYDHVVAIFVQFAAPAERSRMFERMAEALRPDGRLHLLGYAEEQLALGTGGPKEVDRLYSHDLLKSAFPTLGTLEIERYDEVLAEGSAHRGNSALIGYVGRRES